MLPVARVLVLIHSAAIGPRCQRQLTPAQQNMRHFPLPQALAGATVAATSGDRWT
jgi:hypothetical protein